LRTISSKPPAQKEHKMRIRGIKKNYKFSNYLDSSLNTGSPALNYFSFADIYQGTRATNNHFKDLLDNMSTNQSNKLTKIAKDAKKLFNVIINTC
jgi:hypothetical protein